MNEHSEFPVVLKSLKSILNPYASKLIVKTDTDEGFSLDGAHSEKWNKELFFGTAQIKKKYASFYLIPVYMYPDLLKDISPELKNACRENPVSISRKLKHSYSVNLPS